MKSRSPLRKISKRRSAAGEVYSIKRSRAKPKKRSASEFRRIYGSKARVLFVKSLPCVACGVIGFSENAHVAPPSEKGTGYKAGCRFIVPLCTNHRPSNGHFGCHMALHAWGMEKFRAEFPDFDPAIESAKVEAAWLSFSGGSPKTGDGK